MHNKKSQRQLKAGEQIKRILAEIFLKDDNLSLPAVHITINQADISPDLKNAKIFINIFGEINKNKLLKELNAGGSYLRKKLAAKINMRYIPELIFILDNTSDNAAKIYGLIEGEKSRS